MTPKQPNKTRAVRRRLALTSSSTGFLVRDAQQQPDDDKIRHDRAATIANEWQSDARQRDELERAGQDDQRLQRHDRREPRRQQRAEPGARVQGNEKTALQEQDEQTDHRQRTDQAK